MCVGTAVHDDDEQLVRTLALVVLTTTLSASSLHAGLFCGLAISLAPQTI